jgi:hypothetical protein
MNVYQIEISSMGEADYDIFEFVQNKYDLFDNCVLMEDEHGTNQVVVLEGHNKEEVTALFDEIKGILEKQYSVGEGDGQIKIKFVEADISESIIDDPRGEYGELYVDEDALKKAGIPQCYDDYSVGDWSIGDFKLTGTIEFMTGDGKNYMAEFQYGGEKLKLTKPMGFPEEEWDHARDYLEEEVRDFLEDQLLDMRD